MQERLSTAWRSLQNQESRTWGVDDLVHEMERIYGEEDSSVGALEWRLRRSIQRNDLFYPEENVLLNEIVDLGQCTVLLMDTLDKRD